MSLPIATYFAAKDGDSDFAVWAFSWTRMMEQLDSRFALDLCPRFLSVAFHEAMHERANRLLKATGEEVAALPVYPSISNERLEAQQGMFIFDCSPRITLLQTLATMLDGNTCSESFDHTQHEMFDSRKHTKLWTSGMWGMKIVLPANERQQVLMSLRDMNVHEATLFPGLDGFARSLAMLYRARDVRR
jgi:hypothetical protein